MHEYAHFAEFGAPMNSVVSKKGQTQLRTTFNTLQTHTYISYLPHNIVTRHSVMTALQNPLLVNHSDGEIKGPFGNIFLEMLFKCCGNMCE